MVVLSPFDDKEDEEENEDDGDGSSFEDVNDVLPAAVKRGGKAKSPAKSAPRTDKWTAADLDAAHQNRYGWDLPKMVTYQRNYLSAADKTMSNLKDHSKYLNIIVTQLGIAHGVVFTKAAGCQYFVDHNISPTLYNQGLLKPLPQSSSQCFLEKEVIGISHIMVIVVHRNGQNITDDNPNGFGHTCLMGLWGLHTEKAL